MIRRVFTMRTLDLLRVRAKMLGLGRIQVDNGLHTAVTTKSIFAARKSGHYIILVQRADLQRKTHATLPGLVAELAFYLVVLISI